jgi:hypothetical protein
MGGSAIMECVLLTFASKVRTLVDDARDTMSHLLQGPAAVPWESPMPLIFRYAITLCYNYVRTGSAAADEPESQS